MKELSLLLILTLLPLGAVAQSEDMNLDSIYMSYMSDSSKAQIQKVRNEMAHIEQQQQERKERQTLWYLILAGAVVSDIGRMCRQRHYRDRWHLPRGFQRSGRSTAHQQDKGRSHLPVRRNSHFPAGCRLALYVV